MADGQFDRRGAGGGPARGRHVVTALSGLRLRAGPGTDFATLKAFPAGSRVDVLSRAHGWARVDTDGDGRADGHMLALHLRAETAHGAFADGVTPERIAAMFPATPTANIKEHWPHVRAGLRAMGIDDRQMVLAALATIRAETESFRPIDEGRSRFNTLAAPFDRYDKGTSIGARLGNVQAGDGPRFKGRGYVQLTGRYNYTRIGREIGVDLAAMPEQANDPAVAGLILARFLKNHETALRRALTKGDLAEARKLVNGGSHGLERFADAYRRGEAVL